MWDTIKEFQSAETSVRKFVFSKPDAVVESVLYAYPTYKNRTVICCSVQSGCPMGCSFCGTGKYFVRNLEPAEVMAQVEHSLNATGEVPTEIERLQIMFMSMGEPMLNKNTMQSVLRQLAEKYPNAALLVSTSAPAIDYEWVYQISSEIPQIGLQFSIHESDDDARNLLIPFKKKLTLAEIGQVGKEWFNRTGRKPFINYCTHDKNSANTNADTLATLFDPTVFEATVSVICEKDITDGRDMAAFDRATEFSGKLVERGFNTRVFDPAGQDDIGGGCGQLWYVQDWMKEHPELAKSSAGNKVRSC